MANQAKVDWAGWHSAYDDPQSAISRRLKVVQGYIGKWLDETSPRPVRILSLCAGDGRDVIQILQSREDRDRVTATLVEADRDNAERAQRWIDEIGLTHKVKMLHADASRARAYADSIPADLVLIVGVLGNIRPIDIRMLIEALPEICAPQATVVWTRKRRPETVIDLISDWFEDEDFAELPWPEADGLNTYAGAHRFLGQTRSLNAERRLFVFQR